MAFPPKQQFLILAPSCSGKTHYTKRAFGSRGVPLIDGDHVISATCGWPDWSNLDDAGKHAWTKKSVPIIVDVLLANADVSVAYNGAPMELVPECRRRAPKVRIIAVVLTSAQYRKNFALRKAAAERGGSHRGDKWTVDEIVAHAEANALAYRRLGLEVLPSWDAVTRVTSFYVRKPS